MERGRLERNFDGPQASEHDVFVYVPGDHPWTWGGRQFLVRDYAGYSLRLVDPNVMRVHVRFEDETRVQWRVDAAEFPG